MRLELATSGLTGPFKAFFQKLVTPYDSTQRRMDAAFHPFGYGVIDSHQCHHFTPMLALVRVLITKPKLLILDEPSLGLSPNLVAKVFKKISKLNSETGLSVLIVVQKVRDILEFSIRIYSLKLGKIAFSGTPEELNDKTGKS